MCATSYQNRIPHTKEAPLKAFIYIILAISAPPLWAKAERIQVTGSRIKQIDTEGDHPITVIDADAIEQSGELSVGDVLRDLPANSFGSRREGSGGLQSDIATIDLRGLGSGRTLVLVGGRRISQDPLSGDIDLNLIPVKAVERIEVLTTGASAIYGSDALSGVINIILKKDYSGVSMGSQATVTEHKGGGGQNFYYLTGKETSEFSYLGLVQYRRSYAINRKDRDFLAYPYPRAGGVPASIRGKEADGTITDWQTVGCPEDLTYKGTCQYRTDADAEKSPNMNQLNLLASTTYQLSTDAQFFSMVYASRKETDWYWAPTYDQRNITVAKADIIDLIPDPTGLDNAESIEIMTRMVELGRDKRFIATNSLGVQMGFRGYLGDFEWEIGAASDQVWKLQKAENQAYRDRLTSAISDRSFNPFGTPFDRMESSTLEGIRASAYLEQNSKTAFYDATLSGPLLALPYGDLQFATGVSFATYSYEEIMDAALRNGNIWGTMGSSGGEGEREVSSAFIELAAPLLESLQVRLAARVDRYSDYGTSSTPAFSFRYAPTGWLAVRGGLSYGFKAPTLYEMNRDPSLQYVRFRDQVTDQRQEMYITQEGSKNIKEETSLSLFLGTVLAPFRGGKATLDYWQVEVDDVIGYPDIEAITQFEAEGGDPSAFQVEINRDPSSNEITTIKSTYMNVGKKKVRGFDLGLFYQERFGKCSFSASTRHSTLLTFEESGFPGAPAEDQLGKMYRPKVKNNTRLSYSHSGTTTSLIMKHVGAMDKADPKVGTYETYSLSVRGNLLANLRITFGIRNLFDKKPPVDTWMYDLAGRAYYLGAEQSF